MVKQIIAEVQKSLVISTQSATLLRNYRFAPEITGYVNRFCKGLRLFLMRLLAQANVRLNAFSAMKQDNWDLAFDLASRDGEIARDIIEWHWHRAQNRGRGRFVIFDPTT